MTPSAEYTAASPLPGAGRNESLLRAFEILNVISVYPEGASVVELCQATGLPRSTVTRMLASLFDIGAVVRPGSARKWVIGPAILKLAGSSSPLSRLQERGALLLEDITDQLGETSMLAVPTGLATAWVVEEVRSSKLLGVTDSWVGRTVSSSSSGFVRMLLANLPVAESERRTEALARAEDSGISAAKLARLHETIRTVREHDYSVMIDELEEGLAGLGYPVRVGGKLVALLAVYMPSSRFNPDMEARILVSLQSASADLEKFLTEESLGR